MPDESNRQPGEEFEQDKSNRDGGEESDDSQEDVDKALGGEDDDHSEEEVELEQKALDIYNKKNGTSFKSWDGVTKSKKEADEMFRKSGLNSKDKEQKNERKNDKQDPAKVHPVVERMFFKSEPDAELIWDEVKAEAKKLGQDPFELYLNSKYFQGEAKARAEEKTERENARSKQTDPSQKANHQKSEFEGVTKETIQHWLKTGQHDKIEKYGDYMEKQGF